MFVGLLKVGKNTFKVFDNPNDIPKGYQVWNIGNHMPKGYIPYCRLKIIQPFEGGRDIETDTLLALKIS